MRKSGIIALLVVCVACSWLGTGCKGLRGGKKGAQDGRDPNVLASRDQLDFEGLDMDFERFPDPAGGDRLPGDYEPLYFAYDSAVVQGGEQMKLDPVLSELQRNPAARLVVEGHCDERGSREYNLALGERRAQAVRAYLIDMGVGNDRIQTRSYGEENPASMGHDEGSYTLNRRAEFVLFE